MTEPAEPEPRDADRELSAYDEEPDPEAPADQLDPERYARDPDETPVLPEEVTDSDPSGGGPAGLAGEMGVSSEREGEFQRAAGTGTHAAGPPSPQAPLDAREQADPDAVDDPPEQSPDPRRGPEDNPDLPPRTTPTEQAPNPLGPGPEHESDNSWRTVKPE